jgi:plasmid stabilization system protein ParE
VIAWSWIHHPDTSEQFLEAFFDRIAELQTNPHLGAQWLRNRSIRRLLYRMLYVYYRVHEDREEVEVIAVSAGSSERSHSRAATPGAASTGEHLESTWEQIGFIG